MRMWTVRPARGVRPLRAAGLHRFSSHAHARYDPYNAVTQRVTPGDAHDGPLRGWEVSVKENICMRDVPTTCASRMLKDFRSPIDAAVVEHLRASGARLSMRTNCDEFGMGGLNIHSEYGPVVNPAPYADLAEPDFSRYAPRAAGGSSGGAAAAVRAGLCRAAIGTDTGGSVRLPGSYCGTYALKPSYGMISRWGVVSYADSFDTVGIFARSVADVEAVYALVAHWDARDATCVSEDVRGRVQEDVDAALARFGDGARPLANLRVGVPAEMFPAELDPRAAHIVDDVLDALHAAGASIVPVSIPVLTRSAGAYYVQALAEASSNFARFDGVRFGYSAPPAATYYDTVVNTRGHGFGDEVRRRILLGTFALTAEAWDSFYLAAHNSRTELQGQVRALFRAGDRRVGHARGAEDAVDILAYPTCLGPAPLLDVDPSSEYAQDVLNVMANLTGVPALSAPAAATLDESDGARLPLGVSFCAQWGHEHVALRVAQVLGTVSEVLG
ncbi:hypothetical protein MSPP1_003551 [Malassezia sp. CBS 17886]|nr:hypothetical protein MSPP1_003551 [Malassezia sp. CBS 17886]